MKKNNIPLLVIAIATLLLLVGGATYAYFASSGNNTRTNANVDIITANAVNSSFTSRGVDVDLTVDSDKMVESMAGNYIATDTNGQLVVSFLSGTDTSKMACTYDLYYEWQADSSLYTVSGSECYDEEEDDYYYCYASKELTYTITKNNAAYITETNYENHTTSSAQKVVLKTGETIQNQSSTTPTVNAYDITTKFYNLEGITQNSQANKNWKIKYNVENVNCAVTGASNELTNYNGTLAQKIKSAYDDKLNGTDSITVSSWQITNDHENEYRYVGKNPDNYVQFNDELWRIIGAFNMDVCTTDACTSTTKQNVVKIIRNNSFGTMPFDYKRPGVGSSESNGSNDWTDSQIMMLLNPSTYLNTGYKHDNTVLHDSSNLYINNDYVVAKYKISSSAITSSDPINIYRNMGAYFDSSKDPYKPAYTPTSGFSSSTKVTENWKALDSASQAKVAAVKWNLGGTGTYNNATANTPLGYYNSERSNVAYPSSSTTSSIRATYWYGKVGLMYPSDYGYATAGGSTYNRSQCLSYQMSGWQDGSYRTDCARNSWLWYVNTLDSIGTVEFQRTMTPDSSNPSNVFRVYNAGVVQRDNANYAADVRPVLYLETGAGISSGSGTYDDPYILA